MKPIFFTIIFIAVSSMLFAQPFSERELYQAQRLVSLYCQSLESYSKGVSQERFGIEELFGNPANQVFNDLKEGSATIELSTYLNEVTKNKPVIRFGLTPVRNEWEYVSDDGQGRRLLVIAVPKEVDSRRVSNVFYISLKEHPQTGETIVKLANIYQSKIPGYTYRKLNATQPTSYTPAPQPAIEDNPVPAFGDFTETIAGVSIDMVAVKGGTFSMGNNDGGNDEKPVHSVRVNDFYMGRYEVTASQFEAFINATGYQTDAEKRGGSHVWDGSKWGKKTGIDWRCDAAGTRRGREEYSHPVIHVSWNDAIAYCKWLSQKTGKRYRLPTEAEWEYAALGGDKSRGYQYSGSNTINNVAWFRENSGNKTHPVGQKQFNELGIYDMSGNVREWCSDWCGDYYYGSSPQNNPTGPLSGSERVLRGGSWHSHAWYCRVSDRDYYFPGYSDDNYGFRLVLAPE
ncbi:MAG: formylglycine-generating enzyme family protein [Mangrovibacterium sp.]